MNGRAVRAVVVSGLLGILGGEFSGAALDLPDPGASAMAAGAALEREGNWPDALARYHAAITAREQAFGLTHRLVAEALVAYATLHRRDGDWDGLRVRGLLERARAICPECVAGEADVILRMRGIAPEPEKATPSAAVLSRELVREAVARHGLRSLEAARAVDVLAEVLCRDHDAVAPFPALPPSVLRDVEAEYWDNDRLGGDSVLRRAEDRIDYVYGDGSPDPIVPPDRFSARWRGRIVVPATGDYRVAIWGNDGYRLRLDGKLLLEDWTLHFYSPLMKTTDVRLEAGRSYPIEVEYFEFTGVGFIRVGWSGGPIVGLDLPIEEEIDAAKLARFAVETKEALLGPGHTEVGWSLNLLAMAGRVARDFAAARADYERAMAVWERSLGPDHGAVAMTLRDLASLPDKPAGESVELLARSLEKFGKSALRDQPNVISMLRDVAVRLFGSGEGAAVLGEGKDALVERVLGELDGAGLDQPDLAAEITAWLGLGTDGRKWLEAGERALAILEWAYGPDDLRIAGWLPWMAVENAFAGNLERAETLQRRAVGIFESKRGAEDLAVAEALSGLAGYVSGRSPEESLLLARRAGAIWERTSGPNAVGVAGSLVQQAGAEWALGRFDEAREHLERALAIERRTGHVSHGISSVAAVYAEFLVKTGGDLVLARALLEEAIPRLPSRSSPFAGWSAGVLALAAEVEARLGNHGRARDLSSWLEQISRADRAYRARHTSDRRNLEWPPPGLNLLLALAARDAGGPASRSVAWEALVRSRALVLDETGYRNRVSADANDPESLLRLDELRAASGALAGMLVRGETQGEAFVAALARREAAEEALAQRSASYARERAKVRAGPDEVRRALPDRTALVALARFDAIPLGRSESAPARGAARAVYLAFVLRPGAAEPVTVDLGDAETIDRLVTSWRHEVVGQNATAYRNAGAVLRRKIWDPIAATLAGAKRVLVVPDGALHLVNLAALPVAGGKYLIETGPTIHYLSAERDIVASVDRTTGPVRLLALGGADYDAASLFAAFRQDEPIAPEDEQPVLVAGLRPFRGERSACGELKARRFESLPGTTEESTAIAALWREGREEADDNLVFLTGAAAAEAAFKAEAPGAQVLHLATHGFFLGGECAETARGARGIGTLAERATPLPSSGETFRLSGLALAGANHREAAGPDEEDGILTAEEIAALDLSGVDWAVLSACDTGVGDIKAGEGVFGLRRAFQVAGAGTLIASLWAVDDESTREWMTALYEGRLKDELDTAEAVRRASLTVLERRRAEKESTHPFHWAAFVASGDWR